MTTPPPKRTAAQIAKEIAGPYFDNLDEDDYYLLINFIEKALTEYAENKSLISAKNAEEAVQKHVNASLNERAEFNKALFGQAYDKGFTDGIASEALRCDEHCEKARNEALLGLSLKSDVEWYAAMKQGRHEGYEEGIKSKQGIIWNQGWNKGFADGQKDVRDACSEHQHNQYADGFAAGAERMREMAAKVCDEQAKCHELGDSTWKALAESYAVMIRSLPLPESEGV